VWGLLMAGLAMGVAVLGCALPVAAQKEVVAMSVEPFELSRVRLLDGPCLVAQEANRRYLHLLDSDRLLHSCRTNAGLEAPGEALGGWEAPTVEVRGHFVGHYLSACALMYASTGDEELKAKADALVAELAKCQEALGGGYLSAFPASFWDRLESMDRVTWAPYYVIHKIMAGLFDMYTLCGNQQALDVLKRMAAYFKGRLDKLSVWETDRLLAVEFGGMSEVLHNLYGVTGDPDHLQLAHAFDRATFLGPLALEHDNLSRIHANTHIPEVCGAARRYELTGDERYRTIVRYFWERVANARSYATGGSNQAEHWPDPGKLAATLSSDNQESCTTYNVLKVTRYLFRWTGDPRYADFYERAYLNGILGTQNPEDGMLAYFLPLATGHAKAFGTPYDSFWCCYGTGIESFSKLGDSIYFHDDDGVYVNLSIASTVSWPEKGVRLEQRTSFPDEPRTAFILRAEKPVVLTLRVRVPYWATRGVELRVNGEPVEAEAQPSSYLSLRREWKDGDRVEVEMPMGLHAEPLPDDPELAAILYGPLVLAGLTDQDRYFLADLHDLDAWIKPVEGEPLTFTTVGQPMDLRLIPLNRVVHERYGVYWVITPQGSPRHQRILAEEEARRRREARIVDRVVPNDAASEQAHNLQGEKTGAGPFGSKAWRHATDGGWWSWDLKVLPEGVMTLVCVYWGSDTGPRAFDVVVDGRTVGTESLNRNKPGEFFEVEYVLPAELTRGKERVTVRFQAHPGNTAGGVFECAILKAEG